MPKLSRRSTLVLAGVAVAVAGAWGGRYAGGVRGRAARQIAAVFGDGVAADPETARFLAEFEHGFARQYGETAKHSLNLAYGVVPDTLSLDPSRDAKFDQLVIDQFARTTNVIRHHELGEALTFDGIYSPYGMPCGNRLSSFAL